LQNKWEMEAKA